MEKFALNYYKPTKINLDILGEQYQNIYGESINGIKYNPYCIQNIQLYNPIYNRFFDMNNNNFGKIALNHMYHINDLTHVYDMNNPELIEKNVFVKFSPLLDPYRYMIGKYDIKDANIRTMPRFDSTNETVHPKMICHDNASYVDAFFSYLSSNLLHTHKFIHAVDYYGSYIGVQDAFRVSISDDIEFLRNSRFFNENIGKLFVIEDDERVNDGLNIIAGSRQNKHRLLLEDNDDINLDCDLLPDIESVEINDNNDEEVEIIYTKKTRSINSSSDESSSSDSDLNYSSSDESDVDSDAACGSEPDSTSDESSEYTDDEDVFGYIHNFPVQMICMEKCDGTLDELFVTDEISVDNGASYLFQIIMILLVYQKAFKFTHNDLHTNNVMYVNTDKPFLYYNYDGQTYKVPTYGRIMKIIDFGRSIYNFKGKIFCSDSFAPDGDATTQYNMEPFMNSKRPILEPNDSFDLCRLGSSIFDFILEIDVDIDDMDDLQKTIARWCMDDNGKNVLYKKNGEERYPSFKLYKMIARAVHNHTPENQLNEPYFKQFQSSDVQENVLDINKIPCYV